MNSHIKTLRQANAADEEVWDTYLSAVPSASMCHLYGWRSVVEQTYGKRCFYILHHDGQKCRGVLPLVLMRGPMSGNRLVSLPFLDLGGIVAETAEASRQLFEEALSLAASLGVTGLDLRGPNSPSIAEPEATDRFRFLLDLGSGEDDLWKRIGGKVRNQVRKSEKCGLVTKRVSPDKLAEFYRVFSQNMRDLGSPVHSRRFFKQIFDIFGDLALLYITYDERLSPVAGGVAVSFRDTVTVPWASSLLAARAACPNHSLYWRILRDALEEGAATFDFGRSTLGTGTYRFKRQWGAEPVPLAWTSYSPSGSSLKVELPSTRHHRLVTRLWSRLPLRVANLLGPRIRGQLQN